MRCIVLINQIMTCKRRRVNLNKSSWLIKLWCTKYDSNLHLIAWNKYAAENWILAYIRTSCRCKGKLVRSSTGMWIRRPFWGTRSTYWSRWRGYVIPRGHWTLRTQRILVSWFSWVTEMSTEYIYYTKTKQFYWKSCLNMLYLLNVVYSRLTKETPSVHLGMQQQA